jgi:hypothetical protein
VLKLLIAQGLHMVASTAGDLIPAQLGAHDSVFAMANSDFGVPVAALITATTLFHGVQLGVAALGAVVAALSAGMRSAPLPAQSG